MMVRYDEVNTNAEGGLSSLKSPNTGIDADHDLYARSRGSFNHVVFDSVTFFDPVRHMEVGGSAAKLDCCLQDHHGGGAVDIVVTVDQNEFAVCDGGAHALHRFGHAAQQVLRIKPVHRR